MVRKMLRYAAPPGYQRQQAVKRPRLGPWLGVIDAILEDDKRRPAKQRHTAKRIFDRLREEHGFRGGYGIVSQYVRRERLRSREMFVPLAHAAGEAQADFGEALVVVGGVEQKPGPPATGLRRWGGRKASVVSAGNFERDRAAMLSLPAAPYEACEKISARVSSLSLVRYRSNDYSVPTCYGHREVLVKGYVHEVVIACDSAQRN